MNQYAYLGAAWGNNATAGRKNAQQWGQYSANNAQQASGLRVGRRQFQQQQYLNQMQQRDKTFQFGMNALGGLIR